MSSSDPARGVAMPTDADAATSTGTCTLAARWAEVPF